MHHQPVLLIATAEATLRQHLAEQLDADGHTVYSADNRPSTIAKLSAHATDVMLLGELAAAGDAPALLRDLRGDELERIHPGQPVITLGATDDLTTLRAYEAGSDHHIAADSHYLIIRAVVDVVARRTREDVTSRHLHVGELHIDTAARAVDIAGAPVKLSPKEFDLLCQLASDPTRVFTKPQLMRAIWGHDGHRTRTLDSHAARLRQRLEAAGGHGLVANTHGVGYKLTPGP